MISSPAAIEKKPDHRWRFLRDVLVFQLKMFIGSLRDFALIPVSLIAAVVDVVFKGEREGNLFYKVLRWSRHSEEIIDVYSPIRDEGGGVRINPNYTVDSVIARLEGVVVREYEKGGTAANIKEALDKVIDQVHRETREKGEQARNAVARTTDKLKRRENEK